MSSPDYWIRVGILCFVGPMVGNEWRWHTCLQSHCWSLRQIFKEECFPILGVTSAVLDDDCHLVGNARVCSSDRKKIMSGGRSCWQLLMFMNILHLLMWPHSLYTTCWRGALFCWRWCWCQWPPILVVLADIVKQFLSHSFFCIVSFQLSFWSFQNHEL